MVLNVGARLTSLPWGTEFWTWGHSGRFRSIRSTFRTIITYLPTHIVHHLFGPTLRLFQSIPFFSPRDVCNTHSPTLQEPAGYRTNAGDCERRWMFGGCSVTAARS
jgi:hypothetical protein